MAPKVLISDALSPAAVQIFKDNGVEVDYLPEELKGRRYYRPSGNGEEDEGGDRDGGQGA